LRCPEVDAVVVSLKSVESKPALGNALPCRGKSGCVARRFRTVVVQDLLHLRFTDAGNIGPVMDALRADSADAIVLVTPAFPETGRTVYSGNLFVGSVPLNESPLKDHPLNPMHDSNLVRVLARQSKNQNWSRRFFADIARGSGCRPRTPCRSFHQGFRCGDCGRGILPAISKSLARWRSIHRLSVGASGIGLGLGARAGGIGRRVKPIEPNAIVDAPVGGPAACLAGSCSQATLQQIASAERKMPVLHLDSEKVVTGKTDAQRALAWANETSR